jgi:hypothetical protein
MLKSDVMHLRDNACAHAAAHTLALLGIFIWEILTTLLTAVIWF